MAAVTRWVKYDVSAAGTIGDGDNNYKGTRGYSIGTNTSDDTFTIGANNRLYLSIGGTSVPYITLTSGTDLDPRFIARDITEKLHNISGKTTDEWMYAVCEWGNAFSDVGGYDDFGNRFKIYSGELGSSSNVAVTAVGALDVGPTLGFDVVEEQGGLATSNDFDGTISVSGTYYGFYDEIYHVVITNDYVSVRGIGLASKDVTNNYDGTMTTGGIFNGPADTTYVISVNTSNGATMGAGTGNVPTMTWTSTGSDDSTVSIELLYPDHWYSIGEDGLMVKFSDAVFNTCSPAWTIICSAPDYAQGTNANAPIGTAEYAWSSNRGDDSTATITTSSGAYTRLGTRGLEIRFNPMATTWNAYAGDEFYVICNAPDPDTYDINSLNYGNVTVSTESDVKNVLFEVMSGAVEISTVKFGLQSNGTFSHHDAGDNDTKFRFATVGPANNSGPSPTVGVEWYPDATAADIDETLSLYFYAGEADLAEVSDADASEAVGSWGLTADPVWLNIKLGASETGANSTINMRLYFDYS